MLNRAAGSRRGDATPNRARARFALRNRTAETAAAVRSRRFFGLCRRAQASLRARAGSADASLPARAAQARPPGGARSVAATARRRRRHDDGQARPRPRGSGRRFDLGARHRAVARLGFRAQHLRRATLNSSMPHVRSCADNLFWSRDIEAAADVTERERRRRDAVTEPTESSACGGVVTTRSRHTAAARAVALGSMPDRRDSLACAA